MSILKVGSSFHLLRVQLRVVSRWIYCQVSPCIECGYYLIRNPDTGGILPDNAAKHGCLRNTLKMAHNKNFRPIIVDCLHVWDKSTQLWALSLCSRVHREFATHHVYSSGNHA